MILRARCVSKIMGFRKTVRSDLEGIAVGLSEEGGLGAIAQPQPRQHICHMVLDGSFREVKGFGNFAIAGSGSDEFEDIPFAGGEVLEFGWGSRRGGGAEVSGEFGEDAGAELGVALMGGADGVGEGFGGGVFEQITDGSMTESGGDVFVVIKGGEDEDFGGGFLAGDDFGGGDTIHAWHPNVHQHYIGTVEGDLLHSGFAVIRFAYHVNIRLKLQEGAEALANQVLVIHNQQANHGVSEGMSMSRVVPWPGVL